MEISDIIPSTPTLQFVYAIITTVICFLCFYMCIYIVVFRFKLNKILDTGYIDVNGRYSGFVTFLLILVAIIFFGATAMDGIITFNYGRNAFQ